MNVLLLTKSNTYPPTSGAEVRTWKIAEKLSEVGELWVACPQRDDVAYPVELTPIPLNTPLLRKVFREQLWYGLFLAHEHHPLQRLLTARIVEMIDEEDATYDVVISEFPQLAGAAKRIADRDGAKLVLDKHNAYYDFLDQYLRSYPGFVRRRAVANLRRYEQEAINESWMTIFVSDADRDSFTVPSRTRDVVLPNGTDVEFIRESGDPESVARRIGVRSDRPVCLFVGAYDYEPNGVAANVIANDIAPELPRVEFVLAGRNPPDVSGSNLYAPGYVSDLPGMLRLADVGLCPLRSGSGTKLKMLDYLAASLPIVTTSEGIQGLPIRDGETALVRNSTTGFIDAIDELLESHSLRSTLATNAGSLGEQYSWETILDEFEDLLVRP